MVISIKKCHVSGCLAEFHHTFFPVCWQHLIKIVQYVAKVNHNKLLTDADVSFALNHNSLAMHGLLVKQLWKLLVKRRQYFIKRYNKVLAFQKNLEDSKNAN